ncbi:MAG: zinc ribbon domain-containing protein [Methanobrevibacter sp.]
MTRICKNCQYENKDEYDYCAKCGNPLVEGLRPKQVLVYQQDPQLNKKAILIAYIVTIFLSWSGVVATLFFKNKSMATFAFFGFFMPFYLLQAPVRKLKMHGLIMLAISVVGVSLSFYLMMH